MLAEIARLEADLGVTKDDLVRIFVVLFSPSWQQH